MKKALTLSLSLFVIGTSVTPGIMQVAHANENSTVSQISSNNNIQIFDSYVVVENNQFKLKIPSNIVFSEEQIKQVNESIKMANNQIQKTQAFLDPVTKTYSTWSFRSEGYTYDNHWWGTRYHFRSNAAVDEMLHELTDYSLASTVIGALGGLATGGVGVVAGVITTVYYAKVRNDLEHYNNIHRHDYIDMDVYFTGIYKIYTV